MNNQYTELYAIRDIVLKELTYFKTYEGRVLDNNDGELKRGRVKVFIPNIGWQKIADCPWVEPEYNRGQKTPRKDSYVLVWFINGDPNFPVYRPANTGRFLVNRYLEYQDPFTAVLYKDDVENDPLCLTWKRDDQILKLTQGAVDKCLSYLMDMKNLTLSLSYGEKDKGLSIAIDVTNLTAELKLGEDFAVTLDASGKTVALTLGDKISVEVGDGTLKATVDNAVVDMANNAVSLDAGGNKIELTNSKATICGNLEVSM